MYNRNIAPKVFISSYFVVFYLNLRLYVCVCVYCPMFVVIRTCSTQKYNVLKVFTFSNTYK